MLQNNIVWSSSDELILNYYPWFAAILQLFETDVYKETVMNGNDAIFKCEIPSHVADFGEYSLNCIKSHATSNHPTSNHIFEYTYIVIWCRVIWCIHTTNLPYVWFYAAVKTDASNHISRQIFIVEDVIPRHSVPTDPNCDSMSSSSHKLKVWL